VEFSGVDTIGFPVFYFYLVEVLVQCGVFLVQEFPSHSMSMYLKVCVVFCRSKYFTRFASNYLLYNQNQIPGYEQWAGLAWHQVQELCEGRTHDQINNLNDATRTLVASLQGPIVALQNAFDDYKQNSKEQLCSLVEQNRGIMEVLQLLPQQIGVALAGHQMPIDTPGRSSKPTTSCLHTRPCYYC
jgi:hypothetical protein